MSIEFNPIKPLSPNEVEDHVKRVALLVDDLHTEAVVGAGVSKGMHDALAKDHAAQTGHKVATLLPPVSTRLTK